MPPSAYTKQTGRVSLVGLSERKAALTVRVKHLGDEADEGRLVGVFLCEDEGELEGAVLEGRVVGA